MVEPEIYDFLDWVAEVAATYGLVVLPEVHDALRDARAPVRARLLDVRLRAARRSSSTRSRRARRAGLPRTSPRSPSRQFTTLDCHDGIPVRPDLDGILEPREMRDLADLVRAARRQRQPDPVRRRTRTASTCTSSTARTTRRSARTTTGTSPPGRSSCSRRASRRSTTSACSPARNDLAAVARTGEGRAINRHDYTRAEIDEALARPVVVRLLELIRLRNTHPAFDGTLAVDEGPDGALRLAWRHDEASCELEVNVRTGTFAVSTGRGRHAGVRPTRPVEEG